MEIVRREVLNYFEKLTPLVAALECFARREGRVEEEVFGCGVVLIGKVRGGALGIIDMTFAA